MSFIIAYFTLIICIKPSSLLNTVMQKNSRLFFLMAAVLLFGIQKQALSQYIYYCESDVVKRAYLDGTSSQTLATGHNKIAADVSNGFIFYGTEGDVYRADLNGGNEAHIVSWGGMAGAMAFDTNPNDENLFYAGAPEIFEIWSGSYYATTSDYPVDIKPAAISQSDFYDICYNKTTDRIYFSGYDGAMYESNSTGSFGTSIANDNATGAVGVDYLNNMVYWVNNYNELMRTNISTLATTQLFVNSGDILSIDVYPEIAAIYFVDVNGIWRTDLSGGAKTQIIASASITDLALTEDFIPPVFTALSPADNAVDVFTTGTDLVLTFSEAVQISTTTGTADETSVRLYGTLGNFLIDTYTRASANISISGNTVTISGLPSLSYNTDYHVLIGNKVFSDLANNNFIGITLQTGWNFKTEVDQSVFYSRQNGNWDDVNTWSNVSHTGPAATDLPGCTNCSVFIGNGHTVTLTAALSTYGNVEIAPGATLEVNNQDLFIAGIFDIQGDILNVGRLSTSFCDATVNNSSGNLLVVDELIINTSCGVFTLGTDMVVLNGVTITEGTLDTNGFDICDASASPPVSPVFTNITSTSVTISWTPGSGDAFIVGRVAGTTPLDPQIGTMYSWAGGAFGTDEEIGTGNFVVYQGNGTSHSLTGLTAATTYEFDMYSFNSTVGGCYTISNDQFATVTTCLDLPAPTNPVDAAYCSGDIKPAIQVDNPGSGRNINWYDAPTGGNLMTGDLTGGAGRGEIFIPDLASGTFYAEQYDGTFGCASATRTAVTLTLTPAIVIGAASSNQDICNGGDPAPMSSGTASGGTGLYAYQWQSSFNSTGPFSDISGAIAATYDPPAGISQTTYYQCIVTSGSCTATSALITINVISAPIIVSEPSSVSTCAGEAVSFSASATGTTLTYQWVYDNGLSFVDVVNGGVYSGATTNQLQITDVTGLDGVRYFCFVYASGLCETTSAIVNLSVSPLPVVINQTPTLCEAASGSGLAAVDLTSYHAAITSGAANTTVTWFINAALTTPVPSPTTATVSNGTVYYAQVTNTTTTCSTSATATFTVTGRPVVITTPKTICSGTGTNVTLTSSQPNTSYSWTVGANANVSGEAGGAGATINQILTNSAATQQTITYTITPTANGCAGDNVTQTIMVDPSPTVFNVTGGGSYCAGGTGLKVGLSNSQAGITYSLLLSNTPTGLTATPGGGAFEFQSVTTAGTYSVQAATSSNCTQLMNGTAAISIITVPSGGTITSNQPSATVCTGATVTLTATGITNTPENFSWSLPAGVTQVSSNANVITVLAETGTGGTISVTPSNTCGNGAPMQYSLTVAQLPDVSIVLPTELVYATEPASFGFTSTAIPSSLTWSFSDGQSASDPQPVITFATSGTISVSVILTDANGCEGSDTKSLTVRSSDLGTFAIKNVVTPNGDGDNDVLMIERIENFTDSEVIVLDRWGTEVYRKKGYQNDWSFTKGEELLPAGNYVCIVKFDGDVYSRTVTVIKTK